MSTFYPSQALAFSEQETDAAQDTRIVNEDLLSVVDLTPIVDEIIIYPNPIRGNSLNIRSTSALESVQIYSIEGRMVQSEKLTGNEIQVEVSGLSSGMFMVQVTTTSGNTKTIKVMK
jgi:hypothetical protein